MKVFQWEPKLQMVPPVSYDLLCLKTKIANPNLTNQTEEIFNTLLWGEEEVTDNIGMSSRPQTPETARAGELIESMVGISPFGPVPGGAFDDTYFSPFKYFAVDCIVTYPFNHLGMYLKLRKCL